MRSIEPVRHDPITVSIAQLFEAVAEPMCLVAASTRRIEIVNERCADLTGFSGHELAGAELDLLTPDQPVQRVEPCCWTELLGAPGLHDEVPLRRKDGSVFIASFRVSRLAPDWALLAIHDPTPRRKLERELITKHIALRETYGELAEANARLTAANEELATTQRWLSQVEKMATVGRFAAGIAHELNNPLAFVMANLGRMRELVPGLVPVLEALRQTHPEREVIDEVVEELPSLVSDSVRGARRASALVRQLHSFSNVADDVPAKVLLRGLAESALTMVRNQIKQHAKLERDYSDDRPVHCVASQIEQVLVNLLVNAVHAVEQAAGDDPRITLRTGEADGQAYVEIEDTGCGIPADKLGKIMEPFFTTKPAGKGTGLGLAISARIVERHEGALQVSSDVGVGTRIRLLLPVAGEGQPTTERPRVRVHRQLRSDGVLGLDAAASLHRARLAPPAAPVDPAPEPARLRLLLIDDEALLLRALKRRLGRRHEVHTATSGAAAFELLAERPVDAVVCDMMMPDMDGAAFYVELQGRYPQLAERLVFVSGGVFKEHINRFVAEHDLPVLGKPIDMVKLEQKVVELAS